MDHVVTALGPTSFMLGTDKSMSKTQSTGMRVWRGCASVVRTFTFQSSRSKSFDERRGSALHSSRIETKGLVLQDRGPSVTAGDYRRSFTSEHFDRRRSNVASLAAQLLTRALDSPLFDKVVAGARAAAVAYATRKAGELVRGIMPGKKNKKRALQILAKAKEVRSSVPVVLQPLGKQAGARRAVRSTRMTPRRGKGGWAARRVSVPMARGRVMRNSGPSMNGRGATVVRHSEYLGEVAGSVAFSNTPYPINPGLVQSFPWLANIAIQYEQYRFRKLLYRYETEAPSTTKGAVILVTDFDALDSPFTSKDQAMQYKGATRTVTWTRAVHQSKSREADPYSLRYVRSGDVPEGGDQKTYDVGDFQLITGGQADATTIGELYVDYEIELIGPKTNNIIGANLLCADIRGGGTINAANPLGSAPSQVSGTTITVAINGATFTLNASGRFLVYYYLTGTAVTSVNIVAGGGATEITDYGSGVNAAGTGAWACSSIDYSTNQGNGITLSIAATTYTGATMVIAQISSALAVPRPKMRKGLPVLKLEDPTAARLATLESLVRKMGLGCPDCGGLGDHKPGCAPGRPKSLTRHTGV